MSSEWKDILERSGDVNLGATLIRLARQATALHQYQAASTLAVSALHEPVEAGSDPLVPARKGGVRMEVNA